MYHEFFQLSRPPFNNTPDPAFFFASREHDEALATMHFGVQQRRGFVLVTGEVGSGKTLLVRMLMQRLGTAASVAVLDRPPADERELLIGVCGRFGVRVREDASFNDLLAQLERFLISRNTAGRLCVVVIDEAQSLSMSALEQLRMLGNLETATDKLLQVVLLGQPELQDTLGHPALKQLRQRLFCARHLTAFAPEQTAAYIEHRLRVAGAGDRAVFSPGAVLVVHEASEGLPRMINHICDNSLLMAFSESKPLVDEAIVREVLDRMMNLHGAPASAARTPAPTVSAVDESPPRPHVASPSAREMDALCRRAEAERSELMKVLRDIAAVRDDTVAERAQLSGAVTRGQEMHQALTTLLSSCEGEADKLFVVEDRVTSKAAELSSGITKADSLHQRITSQVTQAISVLRALSESDESAVALRDQLLGICDTADGHVGELKALSTSAGLRAEQLAMQEQQAVEIAERLRTKVEESESVADRLELDTNARRASLERLEGLVSAAAVHDAALEARITGARSTERTLSEAATAGQGLAASLTELTKEATDRATVLAESIETVRQAESSLTELAASAGGIDDRLQRVAGQAALTVERADQVANTLEARVCRVEAIAASAEGAAVRVTAGVESAERACQALSELHRTVEADVRRAESLVGRADAAVEALGDLDAMRETIAAATADAARSARGLTETIAMLDERLHRTDAAQRSAELTGETLEQSIQRGAALADRVAEAEQQIAQTAGRLESVTDASSEQADAARAVAERIEAAIATANDQASGLNELADQAAELSTQVRSLSARMDQIHDAPDRLFAEAAASTKQLTDAIQIAGRVLRALSGSASRVREQIHTLKEVRASSDRGVTRLLEQSRASADALRQWVSDAEAARSRVAASLSVDDELADDDATDEPAAGSPDLLPALESILSRRS